MINTSNGSHSEEQKSTVMHDSLNPTWSPPFKFRFPVPSSAIAVTRIIFDVHDKDSFTKDDYLGTTKVDLKDVEISTPGITEQFLSLSLSDISTGEKIPQAAVNVGIQVLSMTEFENQLHETIYEYERWTPTGGWGSDYPGNLLPTDPGRWGNEDGSKFGMDMTYVGEHVSSPPPTLCAHFSNVISCSSQRSRSLRAWPPWTTGKTRADGCTGRTLGKNPGRRRNRPSPSRGVGSGCESAIKKRKHTRQRFPNNIKFTFLTTSLFLSVLSAWRSCSLSAACSSLEYSPS